ncbi:hypothetical protein [Pantoea ananatis]|uniref:hypothetical protein n=1 Tax=Pantoea ananas TaxID=553 RepID=UPI000D5EB65E|nr:hypothetical protein [Pantoea ananatis]PVY80215.1 hypothetical protein C7427_11822 [Pantoea ananatis]
MLPLLRTRNKYPELASAIIKKLSTYTHESFLRRLFEHFQVYKNPAHGVALNYPWSCFLALKWKFIVPEKERAAVMSEKDFIAVINRIYQLQDEAADLSRVEGIFLEMRRMIVNQTFYQSNVRTHATSLARQYIWYCRNPSPFFRDRFFSLTGLRLEDYYGMAHFLMAVFHRDTRRESATYKLSQIILYMVPRYGVEAVGTFLRLISLRPGNIGAFIADYKRPTPVPEEYYERTPFIRRPVLLYEEAAIVFSKQLLGAGLSSLVPELFKENHTGDSRTQKMDFRMHLSALLPDGYPLRQEIKDVIDELSDRTKKFTSYASQIWDGRADEYVRIRELLLRSCESG